MAKIITLKDHKTNELAYPQTVSDAVYMDNGSTLEQYKESVSRQFANYPNVTVTGTVTNLPDNEDIRETEQHTLQLADRNNLEGMGYVILRKNKSFAEQVTQQNTIYEIRYDFDLLNGIVEIPEGCVLDFKGGLLNNVGGLYLGSNVTINGNGATIRLTGTIKMNLYCKIYNTTIRRTTALGNNDAIILFDDSYFDRVESNVGCLMRDCKIYYFVGSGSDTHGSAVEMVSRGGFIYDGFFGITFDNILIQSYCNNGFYVHSEATTVDGVTKNGWITDVVFSRCFVERAKVGWLLVSNSSHPLQEINLVNCSMQCNSWSTYGMDIGFADRVHVVASEFWDWNATSHNVLNVHDNTGEVYIDTITPAKESLGYDLNGVYPNVKGKNEVHIYDYFKTTQDLKFALDLTGTEVKLIDWYNVPDGTYVVEQDASVGSLLGIETSMGGVLIVNSGGGGNNIFKSYIYICNSADPTVSRRGVYFMMLYNKPGNTSILDSSWWYVPTTILSNTNNAIQLKGTSLYLHGTSYQTARDSSLPSANTGLTGQVFSNSSNGLFAVCDGYEWFYLMTRRASMVGATRPTPTAPDAGMCFIDTSLTPARPIWWTGTKWIDATGTEV